MKTRGFSLIEFLVVIAVVAVLAAMVTGCRSDKKVDMALAQTAEQARRAAITEQVLIKLADRGDGIVADTLAAVEQGTAVGWTKADRVLRNPDGTPFMDKDGHVVRETTEAIGKSRTGRDIAGVTKGTLTLAGLPRGKDGDVQLAAIPDGFRLEIEAAAFSSGMNVEWLKVYMEGIASEKAAIVGGMAALAKERSAAFAVRVNAVSKGVAEFLTAAGPIVGRVMRVNPVVAAADLAELGIAKIAEVSVQQDDGTTAKVLVADTPTAATASAVTEIAAANQEAQAPAASK